MDAQKFVCETRRAVAERAENIGIWFTILDMLAQFAVITNVRRSLIGIGHHHNMSIHNFPFQGFLIAFTSEFIPKLVYKYEHDWKMRGYVNFTLATSPKEGWEDLGKAQCR